MNNIRNPILTDNDLYEFNCWIKGKTNIRPRCFNKFKNELEFSYAMMEYEEEMYNEYYYREYYERFMSTKEDKSFRETYPKEYYEKQCS
jgi:hypothetical protein